MRHTDAGFSFANCKVGYASSLASDGIRAVIREESCLVALVGNVSACVSIVPAYVVFPRISSRAFGTSKLIDRCGMHELN
jgi:hypothetical protein